MVYKVKEIIRTLHTGNNFSIRKVHDEGGMGIVYIAERKKDKKLYALKTVKEDKIRNKREEENSIKRFKLESQTWIILGKHRNIVQAHWFDLTSDYKPLLIMEYVEGHTQYGTTLREWLKETSLNLPLALNFTIQALTGLIYAQQVFGKELNRDFVHRDLKPSNILITKNGIIKITDFGLVKAFARIEGDLELKVRDDFGERFSILKSGGICGTPPYMAPEQWRGEDADERTDIYALGCILYEMIMGFSPFLGKNREIIKRKHLKEKPKPLKRAGEKIPEKLSRLILNECLEKEKERRIQSFLKLRDKLQEIHKDLVGEKVKVKEEGESLTAEDWNGRGVGFDTLDFHRKAISCYNEAIRLNSNDVRYHMNRGNACYSLSQFEEAIKNYHKARKIDSQLAEVYTNLGNAYSRRCQYKKAIENYNEAIKLKSELFEVYVSRGNAYANLYQYDKAIKDYERAIKFNPEFAEAYLNLGNVYLCLKDYPKTQVNYNRALKLNERYVEAYINRAKLFHLIGQDEKMMQNLREALKIDPQLVDKLKRMRKDFRRFKEEPGSLEEDQERLEAKQDKSPSGGIRRKRLSKNTSRYQISFNKDK